MHWRTLHLHVGCSAPVELQQLSPLPSRAIVGVLEQPVALRIAVCGLPHDVAVVIHVHCVRALQCGVRAPTRLQRLPGVPAAGACSLNARLWLTSASDTSIK